MSDHSVVITQLRTSGKRPAFVNVEGDLPGHLKLYGNSYTLPTYLFQRGNDWLLVVFEDDGWAKEKIETLREYYPIGFRLHENGFKRL